MLNSDLGNPANFLTAQSQRDLAAKHRAKGTAFASMCANKCEKLAARLQAWEDKTGAPALFDPRSEQVVCSIFGTWMVLPNA